MCNFCKGDTCVESDTLWLDYYARIKLSLLFTVPELADVLRKIVLRQVYEVSETFAEGRRWECLPSLLDNV